MEFESTMQTNDIVALNNNYKKKLRRDLDVVTDENTAKTNLLKKLK